jgi:hypothetical protein
MYEIYSHKSEYYGIHPAHYLSYGVVLYILPPLPGNETCGVIINYEWDYNHAHPTFYPNEKSDIKYKIYTHFNERLAGRLHIPA